MKHIVCFHLLNDHSGSPKVLKDVLMGLLEKGYKVNLYTSDGGVLDELLRYSNLKKTSCSYAYSSSAIVTFLRYFTLQFVTFLLAFRYIFDRDAVFYINTILPFGPALAGRIMRKRVVYHCHEYILKSGQFYHFLGHMMELLASEIICVSNEQRKIIARQENVFVVPNGVPDEMFKHFSVPLESPRRFNTVLMLSSLKLYKGVGKFIELAYMLPQYKFKLVINDTQENINAFFRENNLFPSSNTSIFSRQTDVIPFYKSASIVLNLSDKKKCVETFGLTVIEAMMAGLPVIVPTAGGIKEMVEDGVNGYKIDACNLKQIAEKIKLLLCDKELYEELHRNAFSMREKYLARHMVDSIFEVLSIKEEF